MCINNIKPIQIKLVISLVLLNLSYQGNAQLTQLESMYFQNQYLSNPAMAAREEEEVVINVGYQRQFNSFPGAPVLGYATLEYNLGERMGLGLNINNDKAGIINRTRIMGTYSYHLALDKSNHLDFGISIGAKFASLNDVIGDKDDNVVENFNEKSVLDSDFGISYTRQFLTLQMSFSSLSNHFQKDNYNKQYVDYTTFYSAASFKFMFPGTREDVNFEPLVAYRGIRGHKDIIDAGVRVNMPEYNNLNFSAFYHNNKAVSASFGMMFIDKFGIFVSYSKFVGNTVFKSNVLEFGLSYNFINNTSKETL